MNILIHNKRVLLTRWEYSTWRINFYKGLLNIHAGIYSLTVGLWV